jgi:RsiW-degrading membrane proteinase PrsW (M82 family)
MNGGLSIRRIRTVVTTELLMLLGLVAFVGIAYLAEAITGTHGALRLSSLAALAVAAVPALLWLSYFHAQDRVEPDPRHYVFGVYMLGAFAAGPLSHFLINLATPAVPLASASIDPLAPDRLVHSFLVVGMAQELCKYLVVRFSVYLSVDFDEPLDGIIYMTAAGIGFATWSNYHFFLGLDSQVFLTTGAIHAVVTTMAHACFAGVLGYAMGRAKFTAKSALGRSLTLMIGLLIAAALNGQFRVVQNMVASSGMGTQPWRGVAYVVGFAAAVFVITSILMGRLIGKSPHRRQGGS